MLASCQHCVAPSEIYEHLLDYREALLNQGLTSGSYYVGPLQGSPDMTYDVNLRKLNGAISQLEAVLQLEYGSAHWLNALSIARGEVASLPDVASDATSDWTLVAAAIMGVCGLFAVIRGSGGYGGLG